MKFFSISAIFFSILLSQNVSARTFDAERWQTANGAQVIFYPTTEVPMLDINLAFAAGSAYDGSKFGLSTLTCQLINQGNAHLNTTAVAEQLAAVGAQFNNQSSRDMSTLQLKTLTEKEALNKAVDIFSLIINKPQFNYDAFKHEKNQQLMAITQTKESPSDVANEIFYSKLYKNHPYAHPLNGTIDTVNALQIADVRNFYKQYYVGSNAVLVMVGAITSEEAHHIADKLLNDLPKGQPAPVIPKASPLAAMEETTLNYPSSQTMLRIGQLGIDHHSPEYFPLLVGNYILGGGSLVSRLSLEVREKRGLTYGVVSQFIPLPGDGPFVIGLSTQNNQAMTALKVTRESLAEFIQNGPDEAEVDAAKQYLMGNFPLSLASNSQIAATLLRIGFYRLPVNYLDTYTAQVASVNAEDIKAAFLKHIQPDKMLLVTVGDVKADAAKS